MVFASPFNGLAASGCSNVPCLRWGGGHTNRKSHCQNLHRSHLNSITAVLLHVLFVHTHTHTHCCYIILFGRPFLLWQVDVWHPPWRRHFCRKSYYTAWAIRELYKSTANKSTFHFPLCPATQLVLMCCVFLDVRTGVWLVTASVVIWQNPRTKSSSFLLVIFFICSYLGKWSNLTFD